jgi:hypothetical protein
VPGGHGLLLGAPVLLAVEPAAVVVGLTHGTNAGQRGRPLLSAALKNGRKKTLRHFFRFHIWTTKTKQK